MYLAKNLKNIRQKLGLTAHEFATRIAIHEFHVARYETSNNDEDVPYRYFIEKELCIFFNYVNPRIFSDTDLFIKNENDFTLEKFERNSNKLTDFDALKKEIKVLRKRIEILAPQLNINN